MFYECGSTGCCYVRKNNCPKTNSCLVGEGGMRHRTSNRDWYGDSIAFTLPQMGKRGAQMLFALCPPLGGPDAAGTQTLNLNPQP